MIRKFFKRRGGENFLDPDEVLADSVSALGGSGAEHKIERPIGKVAYLLFFIIGGAVFLYLVSEASKLQLSRGEYFFIKSQENRFSIRPIFPPRGVLYDRFRKPLVDNRPAFGLVLKKDKFIKAGGSTTQLVAKLNEILVKPPAFFHEAGLPPEAEAADLPEEVFIVQGLEAADILPVVLNLQNLPGVQIFESFRRVYRSPFAFSHLLGFMGKVSPEDILKNPEFRGEETIGKAGIELFYDHRLRGRAGRKIVEVDAAGRETRFELVESPEKGHDLVLTIDGELQDRIHSIVGGYTHGNKGASIVVLDPGNSGVQALLSLPGYDSNIFSYQLTQKEFEAVRENPLKPFFNRALSGEFPSGSTIKPLIALAALEEKIVDPNKKIYDPGYLDIPNPYRPGEVSRFLDWRAHGWIDFYDAIAWSANVYFYILGGGYREQSGLGIEKIKKYALDFGLGSRLGIDLPGENTGLVPDPEWKKWSEPDDPIWRIGDTYNVSIGQGGVKVTPLQMASLAASIANGGKLYRPHVLESILDKDGNIETFLAPQLIRQEVVSQESLREVVRGMRQTVTAGTAQLLSNLPVEAAAKTGTAEAGSGPPHAWVIAFAPVKNPKVAIAVMVEHAGEGATVAVPITYEILKWYFENRE